MIRDDEDVQAFKSCVSSRESAAYTYDMLRQLERMAQSHNHMILARLIDLAAREASLLRRFNQA